MLLMGRVALITGASRGIGAATALAMGRHGASVGVNYNASEAAAFKVVAEICAQGAKALAVKADVTDREQVLAMVEEVTRDLGPIDTLVINASMNFAVAPFVNYRWEDFEAKLTAELKAAFFACKAVVPSMMERRNGCIIGVSSGLSRHPGFGFCAHSTAKSGLDAFIKSLALELGPYGIRANVVSPGLTLTDATAWLSQEQKDGSARMTPLGRNARAEDVAGAIVSVAAAEAGFVTGAYIPVSGGILML